MRAAGGRLAMRAAPLAKPGALMRDSRHACLA